MNSEMSGKWLSLQSDLDDLVHPSENAIAKNVFLAHCKGQSPMPTCSKWLNPKMFPETYWAAGYEHQSFQFYQLVQVDVRAGVHSVKDVLEFWFAAWNLDSVIHSLIVRKYIKYLYQKKNRHSFNMLPALFFIGEPERLNRRTVGPLVELYSTLATCWRTWYGVVWRIPQAFSGFLWKGKTCMPSRI